MRTRLFTPLLTRQCINNDMRNGVLDPRSVVAIIIDECHRATGSYAYVGVLDALFASRARYRVVGLSATPGKDYTSVQRVAQALRVSKLEVFQEENETVRQHTHERDVRVEVVPHSGAALAIRTQLREELRKIMSRLVKGLVMPQYMTDVDKVTAHGVRAATKSWQASKKDERAAGGWRGMGYSEAFQLTTSAGQLAGLLDKLERFGFRTALASLTGEDGEAATFGKKAAAKKAGGKKAGGKEAAKKPPAAEKPAPSDARSATLFADLERLTFDVREKLQAAVDAAEKHPKLTRLVEIVRNHFGTRPAGAPALGGDASPVIVRGGWGGGGSIQMLPSEIHNRPP